MRGEEDTDREEGSDDVCVSVESRQVKRHEAVVFPDVYEVRNAMQDPLDRPKDGRWHIALDI